MTQLLSPLTSTPYPSPTNNAITDLLQVDDAVLWLEKYANLRFSTTAARDAAIPSPEDGMMCYITGVTPRTAYYYDGALAAWKILWMGGWAAWTPVFTSGVTVGNGTVSGFYQVQAGKTAQATFQFVLGSTSSITSTILPQFPVPCAASYAQNWNVGSCTFFDVSAGTRQGGGAAVNSTSAGGFGNFLLAGPVNSAAAAVPFTWAVGDMFSATVDFITT